MIDKYVVLMGKVLLLAAAGIVVNATADQTIEHNFDTRFYRFLEDELPKILRTFNEQQRTVIPNIRWYTSKVCVVHPERIQCKGTHSSLTSKGNYSSSTAIYAYEYVEQQSLTGVTYEAKLVEGVKNRVVKKAEFTGECQAKIESQSPDGFYREGCNAGNYAKLLCETQLESFKGMALDCE